MKRSIRIYQAYIKTSFARTVAYLGDFYSSIFSACMFTIFHITQILLLTSKAPVVFGWSRDELIILTLFYNFIRGLFSIFFSGGVNSMTETIFKGDLDGLLLKPINTQFLTSLRYIEFYGIIRLVITVGVVAWFVAVKGLHITLGGVLLAGLLSIFGVLLLYSIWFMAVTLLIWNPVLTNIKDLLAYITGLFRYPPELFKQFGAEAFIVLLPFLLIFMPSSRALVGKLSLADGLSLVIFSLGFLYLSHLFWQFALKHYTSASS